jgi:hypothetical protein
MELRWGDKGSIGQQPVACPQGLPIVPSVRGLPTVLAVNKQLQEETLDVLYENVTVEITMCDDYWVPRHWQCPTRLIDISRLKKILFPIHLQPACPTRSDFPPMLISAQNQGLNTTVQVAHLSVLVSLLKKNELMRELELWVYITWKMIETVDSVKGIQSLIFPIMELSNIQSLQFCVKDFIERKVSVNPAQRTIFAIVDMAATMKPDQGRLITLKLFNMDGEYGNNSPFVTVRDSSWTTLHEAASDGNDTEVRLSLDNGVDIKARDKKGFTALHYAARGGHKVPVEMLLDAGADIDVKGTDGWTPLHLAAGKGHEAVSRLLIRKGADLETRDNIVGYTALHQAASNGREAVLRLLLENPGLNINVRDHKGCTPLLKAVKKGH